MKNTIITLRTSEELKLKLDELALEDNRSLSNFIITILLEYLKNNNQLKE